MAPIKHRSRIHLLAAKEAPVVVILQRKHSKLFHIITVNTEMERASRGTRAAEEPSASHECSSIAPVSDTYSAKLTRQG